MEELDEIKKTLEECNQSHVLKFWDELKENEQKEFYKQLQSIDFKEAVELYKRAQVDPEEQNETIKPQGKMKRIEPESEKETDPETVEEYRKIGLEQVANNRVAVVVLAGGQGTRLGAMFPKGMCPTHIPSEKTLFQLQAERIRRLTQLATKGTDKQCTIKWYVMTSRATHHMTEKYFKEKRYLGLGEENVRMFQQGCLPSFDNDGKVLLEERDSVALAPDGNGGIYRALQKSGIINELEEKDIKYVHVHSLDNILVKVADPVFIGKCVKSDVDCGLKVVRKTDPSEPLGVVTKVDNHYQVVEYSDISKDKSERRDGNDHLVFNAGNICNHFFTTEFLRKVIDKHLDVLKPHIAKKVVPCINLEGERIRTTSPNGIKIEKFIFDVVPLAEKFLAWEVDRSEEFSPVKNNDLAEKDCFSTARRDLLALHKKWIENAGGIAQTDEIEISPLLSYGGENLEFVKGQIYDKPTILYSEEEKKKKEEGLTWL